MYCWDFCLSLRWRYKGSLIILLLLELLTLTRRVILSLYLKTGSSSITLSMQTFGRFKFFKCINVTWFVGSSFVSLFNLSVFSCKSEIKYKWYVSFVIRFIRLIISSNLFCLYVGFILSICKKMSFLLYSTLFCREKLFETT